jgi:hypothetical protein
MVIDGSDHTFGKMFTLLVPTFPAFVVKLERKQICSHHCTVMMDEAIPKHMPLPNTYGALVREGN